MAEYFFMKKFLKWLVYIFLIAIVYFGLIFIIFSIDWNSFADENSISLDEWEYIERVNSFGGITFWGLFLLGLIFGLMTIIKFIVGTIKLFQNKEDITLWKYSTRISILILAIMFIPFSFNVSMSSEIRDHIEKITYKIDGEIRDYVVDSGLFLFEEDWDNWNKLYDRKEFLLAEPKKLTKETDTFKSYINKHPPESHYHRNSPTYRPNVTPTGSHYKDDKKNYFCKSTKLWRISDSGPRSAENRYGIFIKDKTTQTLKILIPHKNTMIFDGDSIGWIRAYDIDSNRNDQRSPQESYSTAGSTGGEYITKWAGRNGVISFSVDDNKLKFVEESYGVKTGCWNRFECPVASIGYSQEIEMECKEITTKKMLEDEVKLHISSI